MEVVEVVTQYLLKSVALITNDLHLLCDRPQAPENHTLTTDENASHVVVVNNTLALKINKNEEVIEIDSSGHESDIIIQQSSPLVVDILDSDSNKNTATIQKPEITGDGQENAALVQKQKEPVLPIKLRLKRKIPLQNKTSKSRKKYRRCCCGCSSSSSSSTSTDDGTSHKRCRNRRIKRKHRAHRRKQKSRSPLCDGSTTSDVEDYVPLAYLKNDKKSRKSHKKKRKSSSRHSKSSRGSSRFPLTPPLSQRCRNFGEFELVSNHDKR